VRRAGLSRQKIAAVKDLAAKYARWTVPPLNKIRRMSEEEIHERLTRVHGIGECPCTCFNVRGSPADVLPVKDYGIRKGFPASLRP